MDTQVVTGEVRFSYEHVFAPHAAKAGEQEKYSLTILVDKTDKKTLKMIEAATKAAIEEGRGDKLGNKIPASLKVPLRDGDIDRPEAEECEGMMFINCNSNRKPGIIDSKGKEIIDPEQVYSGCYGKVDVNFYPYKTDNGSKGIACGLNNIMKTRDGEMLSGTGRSAAQAFGFEAEEDDDLI